MLSSYLKNLADVYSYLLYNYIFWLKFSINYQSANNILAEIK